MCRISADLPTFQGSNELKSSLVENNLVLIQDFGLEVATQRNIGSPNRKDIVQMIDKNIIND